MWCSSENNTEIVQWILLTTTAIVAFAGAAFADGHAGVAFSGDFTLGFNDDNDDGEVDIEALEFTIEEEDVVASRDINRDEMTVDTPSLTRTNSF